MRYEPPVLAPTISDEEAARRREGRPGDDESVLTIGLIVVGGSLLLCILTMLHAYQMAGVIHFHVPFLR